MCRFLFHLEKTAGAHEPTMGYSDCQMFEGIKDPKDLNCFDNSLGHVENTVHLHKKIAASFA